MVRQIGVPAIPPKSTNQQGGESTAGQNAPIQQL
jgi:hypothetical protein